MSVAYFGPCMRLRLKDKTQKLVLLAFAEHADHDGLAHPSVDLVAAEVLCSGRQVQRVVQDLLDLGLLAVHRQASGRGYPTTYRVCPSALGPIPDYRELREAQRAASHPAATQAASRDAEISPQQELLPVDNSHPPVDNSEKGDTQMSPFLPVDNFQKGDILGKKGDISAQKGDIAMSPEPLTYNHKERAVARPVDNSRPGRPLGRSSPAQGGSRPQRGSDGTDPGTYNETLEQIAEKARRHALPPRDRFENDCAFRNRVNVQVGTLKIAENEARRLRIEARRLDESLEDFERRVSDASLRDQGLLSRLTPQEARRQALSIK